ncbi:MFS transporter (macronuclear) [Tetrahymena thermophila SB210]|uniref:MFS transporter n=1 Tax=Tetrahymena thermophila (strain SB210) TaxID=312017 RepID=Q22M89_TETTS|nr:MFS transporter [Tetrahymena thermophila SB210]EAR86251.3 MFS transporter [Tetrahymena thermophila SB210]|eukprot:XP_977131.3 MFS transporter [Tetrahymena thermophila SB210]
MRFIKFKLKQKKVVDTGTSQAVPHLSTNPALRRLTSEFEWDPVFSPQYGRQQNQQNKCYRHWDFPSGPPPQYQPSLKALNFGVRMGSGVFTLVWPITKLLISKVLLNISLSQFKNNNTKNQKLKIQNNLISNNKKGYRHWDFPSGPPPQYQPSLKALNFGVRMGSGVFTLVWPITKLIIKKKQQQKKVIDTGTSQAVPHLSTNPALRRLTSEFEWDPVFSPQYGRQQNY